jgi:DNA-binding HxlR family transcriptional regulator
LTTKPTNPKLIQTCSIWRALDVVGDTPTLLLIQSYWLGVRRFDEFCRQTGLLKPVVSDRLKKLISNECLSKVAYSEKPKRYEYKATEKLIDLFPLALAMLHWERNWSQKPGKLKVVLSHKTCGNITEPFPACGACKQEISPLDVTWETGPGVGMMEASYSPRRRQTTKLSSFTNLQDEVVQIIGDRWAMLILRSIFTGINQFQEILKVTAIATNMLSNRLSELCEDGVLTTREVPGDSRRIEYKLTKKGIATYPIIIALLQWGDKWLPSPEGPPLILTHTPCNSPLKLEMICSSCHQETLAGELSYTLEINNSRGKAANLAD